MFKCPSRTRDFDLILLLSWKISLIMRFSKFARLLTSSKSSLPKFKPPQDSICTVQLVNIHRGSQLMHFWMYLDLKPQCRLCVVLLELRADHLASRLFPRAVKKRLDKSELSALRKNAFSGH